MTLAPRPSRAVSACFLAIALAAVTACETTAPASPPASVQSSTPVLARMAEPAPARTVVQPLNDRGEGIMLPATINGRGVVQLTLDTGSAAFLLFDNPSVRQLALPYTADGDRGVWGYGGAIETLGAEDLTVGLSGFTLTGVDAHMLMEYGPFEDGLIGADLLDSAVVDLDYPAGVVRFHDRTGFEEPGAEWHPLGRWRDIRTVFGMLDYGGARRPVVLNLDTGCINTQMTLYVGGSHQFTQAAAADPHLRAVRAIGIAGEETAYLTKADRLQFGSVVLDRPTIDLTVDHAGHFNGLDGSLCLDAIRGRRTIIDTARDRISFGGRTL